MLAIVRAPRSAVHIVLLAMSIIPMGCRTQEPAVRQVENLDEVLAAVPDAAMRERWRTAQAEGRLPPLESLRLPTQTVSLRQRATVPATDQQSTTVRVPQGVVADVRAIAARLDATGDVRVRLTGTVAMEHEELLSVSRGAGWGWRKGRAGRLRAEGRIESERQCFLRLILPSAFRPLPL